MVWDNDLSRFDRLDKSTKSGITCVLRCEQMFTKLFSKTRLEHPRCVAYFG